jgi:HAD superfamily hydrolase (TIGR01490 family)
MSSRSASPRAATGIALFDLDYTLLGGDATYEWIQFLIRQGVLDADVHGAQLDRFYDDYAAGTLDIHDFLHFDFEPLARHPRAQLEAWREEYLAHAISPIILPKARALIATHEARGDLTAIVTAANAFITRPIAALLGVAHLLASEPETRDGEFTGRIEGIPCFHEGKVKRLDAWLADRGQSLTEFAESYFYGDSQSDVPLMEKVTHPVAVGPDERLAKLARERGWPIISLR